MTQFYVQWLRFVSVVCPCVYFYFYLEMLVKCTGKYDDGRRRRCKINNFYFKHQTSSPSLAPQPLDLLTNKHFLDMFLSTTHTRMLLYAQGYLIFINKNEIIVARRSSRISNTNLYYSFYCTRVEYTQAQLPAQVDGLCCIKCFFLK